MVIIMTADLTVPDVSLEELVEETHLSLLLRVEIASWALSREQAWLQHDSIGSRRAYCGYTGDCILHGA